MSSNNNASSSSDSAISSSAPNTPVTSAQSSVSAVTSTTSRTSQSSAVPHIGKDSLFSSQSPKNTACPSSTTAESTNSSQRPTNSSASPAGYSSQKSRKLVPRSRNDNDERQNKPNSSSVGVQQNQVLTAGSAQGNNTYVIRDNEGRWFLLQTNAAPGGSVHQANAQQFQHHQLQQLSSQLIKPNFINGNATLGQLARSLAPKPPNIGTQVSSNPGTPLLGSSPSNGVTHPGPLRPGTHSASAAASSSQSHSAVVGHYQALRPATNTNPQLLTMINGYYVQPAQPSTINSQSVTASSNLRLHPVTSITSAAVKPSHLHSVNGQQNEKWAAGKNSDGSGNSSPRPNSNIPVSGNAQNSHTPSSLTNSTNNNKSFNSSKTPLCPKAKVNCSVQSHTVAPSGSPVVVMSNGSSAQPSLVNGSGAPLNCSSTQNIRQQLSANSNIHGQLLPVFQQQQNLPRFAPQPSSSHNSSHGGGFRRRAEGDVEFGVENKPPSIECHGESKEAHKVRLLFLKEAQAFREKLGPQNEIVHSVDGLEILESDTPFPPMPPVPLEEWMPRGPSDINRSASRECRSQDIDNVTDSDPLCLDNDSRLGEEIITSTPQSFSKSPCSFDTSPDKNADKKKRKRKTNEVDRLLQMDFGPNEGRLRDFIESSEKTVEKKSNTKGPKTGSESISDLPASPNSSVADGRGSMDEEEEKPSSSVSAKEKKKRGRLPSKKNYKDVDEKRKISKSPDVRDAEKQTKTSDETVAKPDPSAAGQVLAEDVSGDKFSKASQVVESTNITETSLNSSAESTGDLGAGVGNISLSDEDLDTERCIYCDGYLRVKRLVSHPQYCSKKCRKLWKKNPLLSGSGRSVDSTNQQQSDNKSNSATATPSNTTPATVGSFSSNHSAPVSPNSQQRPAMTLILKRNALTSPEPSRSAVLCQGQDDSTTNALDMQRITVHTPAATRVYIPPTPFVVTPQHVPEQQQVAVAHTGMQGVHAAPNYAPPMLAHHSSRAYESRDHTEYPEGHPRTWSCDEVAAWVTRVTGTDAIGEKFRNQDVDGQSLLLMAESEGGIAALLTQKLLLKLGPVLKLEKALKDLIAKSSS